ncbi:NAD kinase [Bacillus kwashiorkori]|uniref:NAD kinase n=1 Tax=Bacillus kwashiorkori TaxID=1522318 RepID=UPI000784654C|nr:NAD kinase [Bacillus kwashiorkori]
MENRRNIYFYSSNKIEIRNKVEHLQNLARQHEFIVVDQPNNANIIVSVGSDGTFLETVRKTGFRDDCLYVGVSIDKQLGFYCDFYIDDIDKMIEATNNKVIEVRKFPTIEVTIDDEKPSFYCLNECTIRSSIVKAFVMDVYIDDFHFETFRGDGMVISTPTGSTGYNKSVHGAVVDPLLPCFQVSELASLNNNKYRTLDSSFILSGDRKLRLEIVQDGNDYPMVSMDNEALGISHMKKAEIQLSGKVIKTVKLKDNSFWNRVQRTFL